VYRTWVKSVEIGTFPDVKRSFQVTRCNHCANPPCVAICPTSAMHQRADGIVDFASDACIGCKACIQACPYDAIYLDPESHTAAKCNYCVHRIDMGLEPACVVVCPEHAILAGDLDDPTSEIARVIARSDVAVRKPEQGTDPKLYYIDGQHAALHPTAAAAGELFAFAETRDHMIGSPGGMFRSGGRMAADMVRVSYNVQHKVQWHWPIPAYLVTKHVAGGVAFLLAMGTFLGIPPAPEVFAGGLTLVLACLAITIALLIYDLDRPDRFFYLLVRPQWRSWLARAAWILASFTAIATAWWVAEVGAWSGVAPGLVGLRPILAALALPFAVLTSIYTAFLFAQAEGRDLWQGAHLPVVMGCQGLMLGAAPLLALGTLPTVSSDWFEAMTGVVLLVATLTGLAATLVGDLGIPLATEIARRAAREMSRGAFRIHYWVGITLWYVPALILWFLPIPDPFTSIETVALTLSIAVGVFLHSWALVMAPQTVENS